MGKQASWTEVKGRGGAACIRMHMERFQNTLVNVWIITHLDADDITKSAQFRRWNKQQFTNPNKKSIWADTAEKKILKTSAFVFDVRRKFSEVYSTYRKKKRIREKRENSEWKHIILISAFYFHRRRKSYCHWKLYTSLPWKGAIAIDIV